MVIFHGYVSLPEGNDYGNNSHESGYGSISTYDILWLELRLEEDHQTLYPKWCVLNPHGAVDLQVFLCRSKIAFERICLRFETQTVLWDLMPSNLDGRVWYCLGQRVIRPYRKRLPTPSTGRLWAILIHTQIVGCITYITFAYNYCTLTPLTSLACSEVSGDQGMLQQQIHWWLGGVQERRNASGYVHFCAPVERCDGSWGG